MFQRIMKFAKSPAGKRVVAWLAPIVIGWIAQRISRPGSTAKTGRKAVKNKAK